MERIKNILSTLSFIGRVYAVGGCVRDTLLGQEPDDIDATTDVYPEEVLRLAEAQGLRVIPTGIEHGTVTIMVDGEPIEVTTFRKDVATDGRRATVAWAETIEEDLSRRDFTINAMAVAADGVIVDPFEGQIDLERKILRTVGLARDRFMEDYLRIVRAFRFAGRFGLRLDSRLTDAAFNLAPEAVDRVSIERIVQEMDKAFKQCHRPSNFLDFMMRARILDQLVPELHQLKFRRQDPKYHPEGDAWIHTLDVVDRAPVDTREWQVHRWAALLHDIGKADAYQSVDGEVWYTYHGHEKEGADLMPRIAQDLKLPSWLQSKLQTLTQLHMRPLHVGDNPSDAAIRRFQSEAGEHLEDLKVLCEADHGRGNSPLFVSQPVPISPVLMGRHLIEAGYTSGPQFKVMLDKAFEHQLDTGEQDINVLLEVATG